MELQSIDTLFTSENIALTVFAILAIIVAFILIKKVAGCLIKTVVFAIILAIMAYIYVNYIQEPEGEPTTGVSVLMEESTN